MFTGREYDEETGLCYYRERHYSTTIGRFLQREPLGIDDENTYAYCYNDPINYIDPYGLWGIELPTGYSGGWGSGGWGGSQPNVGPFGGYPFPGHSMPGGNAPPNIKRKEGTRSQGQGTSENVTHAATEQGREKKEKDKDKQEEPKKDNWWEKFKKQLRELRGDQGYRDDKGNTYKKDQFHKDHIDVTDRRGRMKRQLDIETGRQIWPGGPKNKNR